MKKLWILNHYASDTFFELGGRHYWFARELKKQGYEPVIFCCNTKHGKAENYFDTNELWHEHMTADGIPYVFIRSSFYVGNGKQRIKNMLIFTKNLCTTAKQYAKKYEKPDVILASSVHPFTVLAGEYIAKKMGIPCICEIRDLWPESIVAYDVARRNSLPVKAMYQLEKHIYVKADAIVFTMEGGKDYIVEQGWDTAHGGSVDLAKVYHINNGVDLENFEYNKIHCTVEDSDLDNPEIFKVIYTGSIRLANQINKIVEVAKILQEKNEKLIKILLWGAGDQCNSIQKTIDEEHLTNIVLKGFVAKENIPYILTKSDLNVYILGDTPLYRFGLSLNKSFEYFASGKPVLACANSGYSIIDRYKCGICLDEFTPKTMADAIIHMSTLPKEDYEIYCKNARCAAQDYDFNVLTDKLLAVVEKC